MYFTAMFNNSVVKPFIIANNNALSHLGRGILSYLCPLAGRDSVRGGILSVSRSTNVTASSRAATLSAHVCTTHDSARVRTWHHNDAIRRRYFASRQTL